MVKDGPSSLLEVRSLSDLPAAAKQIAVQGEDARVWLFYGEMGAGKTTLISRVCEELRVEDSVSSPTFSIVNEYRTETGETIYHFDFYRIESIEEAEAIGLDEYLYSGNLCLIEWPEKIEALLPERHMRIDLSINPDSSRSITLAHYE